MFLFLNPKFHILRNNNFSLLTSTRNNIKKISIPPNILLPSPFLYQNDSTKEKQQENPNFATRRTSTQEFERCPAGCRPRQTPTKKKKKKTETASPSPSPPLPPPIAKQSGKRLEPYWNSRQEASE